MEENLPEENFELSSSPDFFMTRLESKGLYLADDLLEKKLDTKLIAMVPADIATEFKVIPVAYDESNGKLTLATDSDTTLRNDRSIQAALPNVKSIRLMLAGSDNIRLALGHYYGYQGAVVRNKFAGIKQSFSIDDSPLKRNVMAMIQNAADAKASDIHLLPFSGGIYVQFRINGHLIDLTEKYAFPASESLNVINVVKSLDTSGNADASKVNVPNRGSFMIRRGDTPIDVRISTVPIGSENSDGSNQKVNLRLLPQTSKNVRLDALGYDMEDLRDIKSILYRSATGLFINSGPTGAGKTTSLYAQMYYVIDTAKEPLHIMTIENPIEIKEDRFTQVQVREAEQENLNLTAKDILKVGLRSDPDIFLYGEIRNEDDARVAVEASTTGHRVFTTVHASNCIKTITRLLDLDVSRMSLLSEIRLIISQRLLGELCPYCSKPHKLTEEEKMILSPTELSYLISPDINLRERGSEQDYIHCPNHCSFGLIGRTAVSEHIIFDMALRDALSRQSSFTEVANLLKVRGFKSMWEKGFELAVQGKFSLAEVIHVIGKET